MKGFVEDFLKKLSEQIYGRFSKGILKETFEGSSVGTSEEMQMFCNRLPREISESPLRKIYEEFLRKTSILKGFSEFKEERFEETLVRFSIYLLGEILNDGGTLRLISGEIRRKLSVCYSKGMSLTL